MPAARATGAAGGVAGSGGGAGLAGVGALKELDRVSASSSLLRGAGLTRDRIGGSVTEQALNGIFRYIAAEEGRLRDNPAGALGGLLKGVLGN